MNPLKPAVSIHIFPPNRCATGCSICGLSDLPSSTSKILRTQEWLIKAIKVTRYRPLYILFSLYLCLFLLFLILPSYTFFEDMTTAISLLWFANHHESPEVIEFNKWRGFGHISMDQKGTVPGVSWIKVDGFTRPKWVFLPFPGASWICYNKKRNNLRDIKKINLDQWWGSFKCQMNSLQLPDLVFQNCFLVYSSYILDSFVRSLKTAKSFLRLFLLWLFGQMYSQTALWSGQSLRALERNSDWWPVPSLAARIADAWRRRGWKGQLNLPDL